MITAGFFLKKKKKKKKKKKIKFRVQGSGILGARSQAGQRLVTTGLLPRSVDSFELDHDTRCRMNGATDCLVAFDTEPED